MRRDDAGRFCLGLGLVALGHGAARRSRSPSSPARCSPSCATHTGESVQLFVREGDGRRCVVSLPSPHGLRWIVPEGALLPLDLGSAGRVLTGELGPRRLGRERRGARAGRRLGERAGRRAATGVLAAVSVSGPVERLTRQPGKRFGADVVAAASDIAASL